MSTETTGSPSPTERRKTMFMTRWRPMGLNPFRELDQLFRTFDGESVSYTPAVDIT